MKLGRVPLLLLTLRHFLSHLAVCLSPLNSIPFPECAMKLALGKTAKAQMCVGLKAQFDLCARSLGAGLALALADMRPLWCFFLGHGGGQQHCLNCSRSWSDWNLAAR
jgi:hypothetical protein